MNSESTEKNEKKLEQNEETQNSPKFSIGDVLEFDSDSALGSDIFATKIEVKQLEAEGLSVYYLVECTERKVQAWYPRFFIEQVYKKVN